MKSEIKTVSSQETRNEECVDYGVDVNHNAYARRSWLIWKHSERFVTKAELSRLGYAEGNENIRREYSEWIPCDIPYTVTDRQWVTVWQSQILRTCAACGVVDVIHGLDAWDDPGTWECECGHRFEVTRRNGEVVIK